MEVFWCVKLISVPDKLCLFFADELETGITGLSGPTILFMYRIAGNIGGELNLADWRI